VLNSISAATIDRLLKPIRAKTGRRACLAPSPHLLKQHIPIQAVHGCHSAGSLRPTRWRIAAIVGSDFVWSLTMTDIVPMDRMQATWTKAQGLMTRINYSKSLRSDQRIRLR